MQVTTHTKLTCPECGFVQAAAMPTDACQFFYRCHNCQAVLRPKAGDCCVFCSYADVPCPSKQPIGSEPLLDPAANVSLSTENDNS